MFNLSYQRYVILRLTLCWVLYDYIPRKIAPLLQSLDLLSCLQVLGTESFLPDEGGDFDPIPRAMEKSALFFRD